MKHGWQVSESLVDWLRDEPYCFEFCQIVRLLEALRPNTLNAGESDAPSASNVRFRSEVSLNFPASEVQSLDLTPKSAELTVNILGLAGALGPLPHAYTEMLLTGIAQKNLAGAAFLDIFNHRLISLLYRVRQAHEPALTARMPHEGLLASHLFAVTGLGDRNAREPLGFPVRSLLHYSGLLARRSRTAAGLECLLQDHFQVPVAIRQLSGLWRHIDATQWTRLGRSGLNQTLGSGAALGTRVWDQAGGVTISIGPISIDEFECFLPGGPKFPMLSRLAAFYLGIEIKPRVRLTLQAHQCPQLRLGKRRLGYTSWLQRDSRCSPEKSIEIELQQ